jgi:hypothetical protein
MSVVESELAQVKEDRASVGENASATCTWMQIRRGNNLSQLSDQRRACNVTVL